MKVCRKNLHPNSILGAHFSCFLYYILHTKSSVSANKCNVSENSVHSPFFYCLDIFCKELCILTFFTDTTQLSLL